MTSLQSGQENKHVHASQIETTVQQLSVDGTSIETHPDAWVVKSISVWTWIVDVLILAEMNVCLLPEGCEGQRWAVCRLDVSWIDVFWMMPQEESENDGVEWVSVGLEWLVGPLIQLVEPKLRDEEEEDPLIHWVVTCLGEEMEVEKLVVLGLVVVEVAKSPSSASPEIHDELKSGHLSVLHGLS